MHPLDTRCAPAQLAHTVALLLQHVVPVQGVCDSAMVAPAADGESAAFRCGGARGATTPVKQVRISRQACGAAQVAG